MSHYESDPFFQVTRVARTTSLGVTELPALYYDVSHVLALFVVEYDAAAAKLAGLGLKPGLYWGRRVVAGLAFYEYRETSLGPYNEVGLGIPALPLHRTLPLGGWLDMRSSLRTRRLGHYILNLPVTTEVACVGGRELYGYPKFVTELPFKLDDRSFRGEVLDPVTREPIVTLAGTLGAAVPGPAMSMVLYSCLGNQRLRATVDVRGPVHVRGKGGLRLSVGASGHEMARNLRDLGLEGQAPFLVMDTHRFQSHLNAGEPFDWSVQ